MNSESSMLHPRAALTRHGLSDHDLAKSLRTGRLQRQYRGVYHRPLPDAADAFQAALARHRDLARSAALAGTDGRVVSHVSAAVLHGLWLLGPDLEFPHFTVDRKEGGTTSAARIHPAALPATDVVEVDGVLATSVARTAVDVARVGGLTKAVVIFDSALRQGASREDLHRIIAESKGRTGIGHARAALPLASELSESPGESWSRALMHRWDDLPTPSLQVPLCLPGGRMAYGDFGWQKDGRLVAIGEFDGLAKYIRYLKPDETSADAVQREKWREDAIRGLGLVVLRWGWEHNQHPERLRDILVTGLTRAGFNL